MNIIDLSVLIDNVPRLCNLFLYGFIFMTIYTWLTNKKLDMYLYILWGLFVNFIIVNFYKATYTFIFDDYYFSEPIKILIYSISAISLPFIITFILNTNKVRNILSKCANKTISDDILDDVIDYKKKNIVKAYLKDSNLYYLGSLAIREEKGSDSYIGLIDYQVFNMDTGELLLDTTQEDYQTSVILNLHDLKSVELYYSSGSDTWEWLSGNRKCNSKFCTDAKSFYSLETSVKKPIDISKMTGQQNKK